MGILSAFRFAFQNLFFTPVLYGVIASLAVFSTVWDKGDRLKDQLTDRFRNQEDTFDFVIVGGGSAGAVLANRLSQYHTVLLLEAGGETHPFQAIPGLSIFIPKNPGTDWMHKSVTQSKSCFACPHKKYVLSQGRNLGGSGNIDYMMYLRGNPFDFNNWATITDDPTWGYDGVVPYFVKSEHFIGDSTDKTAHGFGGPLQIQIPDCIGLSNEWNLAGEEMGYPHIDLNGRHSEGFDTIFYPIKHGVRQATYRSYIQPVRNRPSLLIRKFAHVNKILIREASNEAYGVVYDRHGHTKHAYANKEIILSAGTLQTPKLLVLSGVGQLEHLHALHVPVRSVLPVGKNLQDHIGTLLGPFYINKPRTISFDRDITKQSFVQFAASGKGPLSTTGFQATGVFTSSLAKAQGQDGWPDIQMTLFGLTPHRMFYSDIGHAFGLRQDILHRYYGDANGKEDAFFIMVSLARPVSKGDYCVSRNDPYKAPVIDPNYLMDPEGQDIRVLVEGIHRALYLAENTTAFRSLETLYSPKCFPGCENVPFRSYEYWECYVRHFSVAMNDHVGTCPMGKVGSPYAVVDPQLCVQGVKGLRVVDASVMPTIVGTPTQAATIMIAERASEFILDKWKHDAKALYGPPGKQPGLALSLYGPPEISTQFGSSAPTPTQQYGPPNIQYGPPGATGGPIGTGNTFSNYDSFSVIKDQLNSATPGGLDVLPPTSPTTLIPLQPPETQVWSSPKPFPSSSAVPFSPGSPLISNVASTPPSLLAQEPSQQLVPPGELQTLPLPNYATSFSTANFDFANTTPDYSAASFNFDTARSASENDNDKTDTALTDIENTTEVSSTRRGKSFGSPVDSPLEGNQLGHGELDEEDLLFSTTTPTSIHTHLSTATTVQPSVSRSPVTQSADVRGQGSGLGVIRKRIRTTPRVVVHPRGHLGHQHVERKSPKKLNESLENLLLTTSSVRPMPKDFVKIRRRRPVTNRRTTTTPVLPTVDVHSVEDKTFYGDAFEYTTPTNQPRNELPSELLSPGRKRFVRRMFARPYSFNGKTRWRGQRAYSSKQYLTEATAITPIIVAASSTIAEVRPTTNKTEVEEESRVDENDDKNVTTSYPLYISEEDEDKPLDSSSRVSLLDAFPSRVFRNIEDEDGLSRKIRSEYVINSSKYSVESDDVNNPIILMDLNPVPEIIAAEGILSETEGQPELVEIPMDTEHDDNAGGADSGKAQLNDKLDKAISIANDFEDGDKQAEQGFRAYSSEEDILSRSFNFTKVDEGDGNKISLNKSQRNSTGNSRIDGIKYSVVVSSSSSNSNNNYNSSKDKVLRNTKSVNYTTATVKQDIDYEDHYVENREGSTTTSSRTTTLNPRYNFRMRNKLIRTHS